MDPSNFVFKNPQAQSFDLSKNRLAMDISNVFLDMGFYSEINVIGLFLVHFNCIPNIIHAKMLDCKKASDWFMKTYSDEIKDIYFYKRHLNNHKNLEFDDIYYFLNEDLIVYFNTNQSEVKFLFRKTTIVKVDAMVKEIQKFKIKTHRNQPKISLLISTPVGLDTKTFDVLKPKLKLEDNYNDDFNEIHKTILKKLIRKNEKGLVLLHGKPGTGKTSYIRYLISLVKKNVIFLPPNLVSAITNPNLIKLLIENPNSIFVIEDAENIVVDREKDGTSPVSGLLNITDGLLSDCLSIQIICSFNTDISKIDSALMRKGRLIAKYEFNELEVGKAQMLANKLGYNTIINQPMTLTDIYNLNDSDFQQTKKRNPIGFKTINSN